MSDDVVSSCTDQSLNVEHLLPGFSTVYQGILRGVFRQLAEHGFLAKP